MREQFLEFVKAQHGEQLRKYTNEPYWHHCVAVADMVNDIYPYNDVLYCVALGHDLYEDTQCNIHILLNTCLEIGFTFPQAFAIHYGISALTDIFTKENFWEFNRKERKDLEIARLSTIKPEYQTIKYADLIDNTKSIVEHDKNFAVVYLKEKECLLDKMRMGDPLLFHKCYILLHQSLKQL